MRGVEATSVGHVSLTHLLQVHETDHHVRNLHAGVVDVVLDVDGVSGRAQQSDKGVAQDCVAQMADVCRLVRVDAGVLHQNLAAHVGGPFSSVIVSHSRLRVPLRVPRLQHRALTVR